MKQKSSSSQVVTKAYLVKVLDERFAVSDRKVNEKFVRYEVKFDLKLENLERKIDEKAKQYRDQILTSNDKLAKTLETMREELELGNLQMRRQLGTHEERIKVLESA